VTIAVDRKDFLRVVAISGAGLSLGLEMASAPADAAAPAMAAPPAFVPVAWVEMGNDGLTTVVINQTELGQGITTHSRCASPKNSTSRCRACASASRRRDQIL